MCSEFCSAPTAAIRAGRADRCYLGEAHAREFGPQSHSGGRFSRLAAHEQDFDAIALYDTSRQNVSFHWEVELVPAARVTGGFFEVLRVRPIALKHLQKSIPASVQAAAIALANDLMVNHSERVLSGSAIQ